MTKRMFWLTALVGAVIISACSKVGFNSSVDTSVCTRLGIRTQKCGLESHLQTAEVRANVDVDILFVVDNSGSMQQEQTGIGNKINGFIDKIKDLNWQIAITTTDDRVNTLDALDTARPWGDGQFRPFDSDTGSQFILTNAVTAAEAQTKLAAAIQFGVRGSGNERGVNATYRAVSRAGVAGANKDFFRSGARLAVIAISDEDECSTGAAECTTRSAATEGQSDPATLINLVKLQLGNDKVFTFNSIVKIPGDATCTTGANDGDVYKDAATLTGGILGSVCATDYTTPLASLGKRVVELVKAVSLNCMPQDLDGDANADIRIMLAGGTIVTTGFSVSGNTVTFTDALPEGVHQFAYFCDLPGAVSGSP